MKKVFVLLFGLLAAGQVFAAVGLATACNAGNATLVPGDSTGASFLRVDILPKCSANVNMKYNQTANGFAVGANSTKGKFMFFGNTGGGAVAPDGVCADATPCSGTKLDAGIATAMALAT